MTENKKRKEKCSSSEESIPDPDENRSKKQESKIQSPPRKVTKKNIKESQMTDKMADMLQLDAEKFAQMLATPVVIEAMKNIMTPLLDEKLSAIDQRVNIVVEKQEEIQKTMKEKDDKMGKMEERLDNVEQQSKKNRLILTGLEEDVGEKIQERVIAFLKKTMGLEINDKWLLYAFRIGKKTPGKHRPILFELANGGFKQEIYGSRIKMSKTKDGGKVYLNEDLTPARSKLFYETRQLLKTGRIQSCWTVSGSIYVRSPTGITRPIRSLVDLSELKRTWAEAAAPRETEEPA